MVLAGIRRAQMIRVVVEIQKLLKFKVKGGRPWWYHLGILIISRKKKASEECTRTYSRLEVNIVMLSRKAVLTYMALGSFSATSAGENPKAFRSTQIRSCKVIGRAAASRSWLRSELGGQSCLASMLLRGGYGYDRRNYGGGYYYDGDDLDEDFDDDEEDEGDVFSYGNRRATQREQQGGMFSGLGSTFQGMSFMGGNMKQMRE